jgi:hypothetical protein
MCKYQIDRLFHSPGPRTQNARVSHISLAFSAHSGGFPTMIDDRSSRGQVFSINSLLMYAGPWSFNAFSRILNAYRWERGSQCSCWRRLVTWFFPSPLRMTLEAAFCTLRYLESKCLWDTFHYRQLWCYGGQRTHPELKWTTWCPGIPLAGSHRILKPETCKICKG